VLKLFEGIPINMADGFGGSDIFLPTEALGDIRIFKGPASVYYGPAAMAGAVDHRLRVFDRPALRLNLSDDTGTFGTRSAFVAVPYKTGSAQNPNSQITLFTERKPGRYAYDSTSTGLSGRLDNNLTDTQRVTASSDTKIGDTVVRPRVVAVQTKGSTPGSITAPANSTFDTTGLLASIEALHSFGENFSLGLRISDTHIWSKFDQGTSDFTSGRTGAAVDSQWALNESLTMRTFIDVNDQNFSATFFNGKDLNQTDFEAGQSYEISLSPTLILQPGYRYRASSGDIFKAIALIDAEDQRKSWLSYSEGYRAPSLGDRFADVSYFRGNPGLRAETARNYEAGTRFENGRRYGTFFEGTAVEATVYQTQYHDFIESIPVVPGTSTKINSGDARVIGAELDTSYGVGIWTLALAYNHLFERKNTTTDEQLSLAPKHQFIASLAQQLGPLVIEEKVTYWSSYFDHDLGRLRELPDWALVDLTMRTVGLADWEIRTGILNILDRPRELTIGYPEPQRRFFISALRFF
jgi:outer membrane receptor protein involved in Fe transport